MRRVPVPAHRRGRRVQQPGEAGERVRQQVPGGGAVYPTPLPGVDVVAEAAAEIGNPGLQGLGGDGRPVGAVGQHRRVPFRRV